MVLRSSRWYTFCFLRWHSEHEVTTRLRFSGSWVLLVYISNTSMYTGGANVELRLVGNKPTHGGFPSRIAFQCTLLGSYLVI